MKTYPLFKVHISLNDAMSRIKDVLESGFINEGIQVTEFSEGIKNSLSANNLILVNSCTSALTLALKLAGVEYGDDVISTPMTCVATNTPIINSGANIVWADIDPDTGMLNPMSVISKITNKTKAIIAVAWAGTPPDLKNLSELCKSKNIKLILDAAHAYGAEYENFPIHFWADYTCYSFQAIKHITTGDGGALVCKSNEDYQRSKRLKWFGLDRDHAKDDKGNWKGQQWDVDIIEAGYKFNMNNLTAAVGLSQLPYIEGIINSHRNNAKLYDELFKTCDQVKPIKQPNNCKSSYWVYTMKLNKKYKKISRDELLKKLNLDGIMAGVVHVPNNDYTTFKNFQVNLPGVCEFSDYQFSLPCGWWLNEDDVRYISQKVIDVCIG